MSFFNETYKRQLMKFIGYVEIGIHIIANSQMQQRLLFLNNISTLLIDNLIEWNYLLSLNM
jgi:hypothetical protein